VSLNSKNINTHKPKKSTAHAPGAITGSEHHILRKSEFTKLLEKKLKGVFRKKKKFKLF